MPEHVDIHAPAAFLGLARLDAATNDVTVLWNNGVSRIKRIIETEPWGQDSAGKAFLAAYTKDGGPERMIQDGNMLMKDVNALGVKVRTAVSRTRVTDQAQAEATTWNV
ncbi:hypothetical protein GCM10022226_36100 [Sphaerisporangium flaviroseum]|uniref:Uncharacterized protein n=1 Tax=Sphaerisporangium flaviroseum TaxID=509199 RepID=A0ABP7I8K3_9ACTN